MGPVSASQMQSRRNGVNKIKLAIAAVVVTAGLTGVAVIGLNSKNETSNSKKIDKIITVKKVENLDDLNKLIDQTAVLDAELRRMDIGKPQ